MSVNDRGTIKWTSLMLPEHVKMINEWHEVDNWQTKPILDEQQIEENGRKLQMAFQNNLTVEIKYHKDRYFHTVKCKIYNVSNDIIIMDDEDRTRIKFGDVVDVYID